MNDNNDFKTRCNLASAYQIIAKLGWDDHTYTHLSARPDKADYYYIYPFGLRFEEVTAENLLKVNMEGEILEGTESHCNKTGSTIHGNIYKERPDLNAIFHLHTIASVAVSAMRKGLMPLTQWALHLYDQLAYHEYDSLALDNNRHGKPLVHDLGDKKNIFLRSHGFITTGAKIHEAMFYCYHLEMACRAQVAILSMNQELIIPNEDICKKSNHDLLNFEKDLGIRDWEAWLRWIRSRNNRTPKKLLHDSFFSIYSSIS